MPRKTKDDNKRVVCKSVTMYPALFEYMRSKNTISRAIRDLITADVIGISQSEFISSIYHTHTSVTNRSHSQDTLEQEYNRVAKWMLESRILHAAYLPHENRVYLEVHWMVTDKVTIVKVDLNTEGFVHVIYDEIICDTDEDRESFNWGKYLTTDDRFQDADPDDYNYISVDISEINSTYGIIDTISSIENLYGIDCDHGCKLDLVQRWIEVQNYGRGV